MKNYVKIQLVEANGDSIAENYYFIPMDHTNMAVLSDELENLEAGQQIRLSIVEMEEEKFYSLSEFEGWY